MSEKLEHRSLFWIDQSELGFKTMAHSIKEVEIVSNISLKIYMVSWRWPAENIL